MKTTRLCATAFIAVSLFGLASTAGCSQHVEQAETTTSSSQSLAAGEQARTRFGVANYEVRLNPNEDGNHVTVDMRGADGALIGNVITYRESTGDSVFRITLGGTTTDVRSNAETLTVLRDGVVTYTLERSKVTGSGTIAELDASNPLPEAVASALGLAATVISDKVLIDYVASVSPSAVPYLVKDCPWWVTLAACVGWETGVGAVMCVACGASYLL